MVGEVSDPAFRARLLVAALCSLGVPENDAHKLMWMAVDEDPFAGVERALLTVMRRAPSPAEAQAIKDAAALIEDMSVRIDVLERYIREMERDSVLPLRPRGR